MEFKEGDLIICTETKAPLAFPKDVVYKVFVGSYFKLSIRDATGMQYTIDYLNETDWCKFILATDLIKSLY